MQQLKAGAAAAARESRVNPRSIKEWKALGDGDLSKIRRLGDNATATAGIQSGQAWEADAGPRASSGAEREAAAPSSPKKKRKRLQAASSSESESSGQESTEDDDSEAKDTKACGGAGEGAALASDEDSALRKSEISKSAAWGAGVAVQAQAQVLARSTRGLVAQEEKETRAGCSSAAGGSGWRRGAGAVKAGGAAGSPRKQVLSICHMCACVYLLQFHFRRRAVLRGFWLTSLPALAAQNHRHVWRQCKSERGRGWEGAEAEG